MADPIDQMHTFQDGSRAIVSRNNKGTFPVIRVKVITEGHSRAALARAAQRMVGAGERLVPMFTREEGPETVHYFTASQEPRDARQAGRMARPRKVKEKASAAS